MPGALDLQQNLEALERRYDGTRDSASDATSTESGYYRLGDEVDKLCGLVPGCILCLDGIRTFGSLETAISPSRQMTRFGCDWYIRPTCSRLS